MSSAEDVRAEVEAWVDQNWDPELSVEQWWQRLADSGLARPMFAPPYGRGWGPAEARVVSAVIAEKGALGPAGGLGVLLAAPTILEHGTTEQIDRYVRPILDGTEGWCQLFSEPGAGSDLAGLQTKAERDGDEYVITGQKVWTSTGQYADFGMLVARTDSNLPKHQGLSYFAFPMLQDGVEVRPLKEMTGRSIFNEVFLDEARVPAANLIGGLNQGWAVTNTTLMVERSGIGGGHGGGSAALPGTVAGHLSRPAQSFVGLREALASGGVGSGRVNQLLSLAKEVGRNDDPIVRQELAKLYTKVEIIRMTSLYLKAGLGRTGGEGSMAKIRMTDAIRHAADVGNLLIGAYGQILGDDTLTAGSIQELTVFAPGPAIYGGTDEIQRNVIGERALGLPKEPGPDKNTPFNELLTN